MFFCTVIAFCELLEARNIFVNFISSLFFNKLANSLDLFCD